jgi:hypothetical protein
MSLEKAANIFLLLVYGAMIFYMGWHFYDEDHCVAQGKEWINERCEDK